MEALKYSWEADNSTETWALQSSKSSWDGVDEDAMGAFKEPLLAGVETKAGEVAVVDMVSVGAGKKLPDDDEDETIPPPFRLVR